MAAPEPNRVVPERSARELADYKAKIASELRVHVYYIPGREFIVAPLDGNRGLFVEVRDVTKLPEDVDNELLGRIICNNLLWNVPEVPRDLRDRKMTDWPAYIASGFKSVRQFQTKSIYIDIHTINTVLSIEARPLADYVAADIFLGSQLPLGPDHDLIGERIRKLLRGLSLLQKADFY